MKFEAKVVRAIDAGRKTQLRRPDKPPYKVGDVVPVIGPERDEFTGEQIMRRQFSVRILRVVEQDLRAVTPEEASCEAFSDLETFFAAFRVKYDLGPRVAEPVPIWMVEFEVDRSHQPRLLHRDSSRGYTRSRHQAMNDEPESVDVETLNDYAKRNRGRHARVQRKFLEEKLAACKTPDERVEVLKREAREQGVDVRSELSSLERRLIQKIERQAA